MPMVMTDTPTDDLSPLKVGENYFCVFRMGFGGKPI